MAMTRPRSAAARPASDGPARRGRPGYDRQALLAVAVAVFNERGYDGTSMEDLSRRLGIAKSSIYYHVDGKEDLLRMALDRALDGLFSVVAQVAERDERAIDRLEYLVRGSVAVLADRLPYVTLLLRARGTPAPSAERWPAGASSTGSWPTWSPRPSATGTSGPT